MVMVHLTLFANVDLGMGAIWMRSSPFNKIFRMISEKEKLPSMKVSDILDVIWPVNIL
jgi:hypothetical protein